MQKVIGVELSHPKMQVLDVTEQDKRLNIYKLTLLQSDSPLSSQSLSPMV